MSRWLFAILVAAIGAAGCTPTCERAMAQKNYALAATQCEKAWHSGKDAKHALATIRALGLLNKEKEVAARLSWLDDTPYAPATHYYRALAARTKGDDDGADAALKTCLTGTVSAGLHDFAARCARQLASLQWTRGRFQDAFITLALALNEVKLSDDPILEAKVYGQLADLLAEVGDEAGEGRALIAVAERFKPISPGGYAQVRLRQGLLELNRGHPQIARDAFEEALALSADAGLLPVVRSAHVNLAAVARSARDFDGGQIHLDKAAAIPAQRGYENSTLAFAQAQLFGDQGRWREAESIALAALDAGAVPDWQWQLSTLQGESLERLGEPASARAAYQRATAVIEELRRALGAQALRPGLLAERRRPYEALFELHLQQNDLHAAAEVMEQLLAASFLESMATAQNPTANLQSAATEAVRRITTTAAIAQYHQAQVPAPIAQVLERLGKREVLAFLTARGTVYRLHLVGGKLDAQRLGPSQALTEKWQQLEAQPGDDAAEALGRALWPSPAPGPDVLIVADASLATLSFAGLKVGGRHLVEDHVLSYAPALGVAAAVQARPSSGKGVVVLGDPTSDLPGAAAEAEQTAQRLGTTAALGPAATLEKLHASCGAQLLHVAAHSGVGPDGAWLAMADGKITAATLLAQRCGPSSVYLASCASAASARADGSGTLANAFLAAGSRFVVATTRSIDDATAAAFARALFVDGTWDQLPARVAAAQRALLKSGAPRSTWEPFIVLGP